MEFKTQEHCTYNESNKEFRLIISRVADAIITTPNKESKLLKEKKERKINHTFSIKKSFLQFLNAIYIIIYVCDEIIAELYKSE